MASSSCLHLTTVISIGHIPPATLTRSSGNGSSILKKVPYRTFKVFAFKVISFISLTNGFKYFLKEGLTNKPFKELSCLWLVIVKPSASDFLFFV